MTDSLDATIRNVQVDKLGPLYRAFQNRFQLQATLGIRTVDPLIGQDEESASLTAQWGFPRLPGNVANRDAALAWLAPEGRTAPSERHPHSFAAEVSYADKDPITDAMNSALNVAEFRELSASFNWSTKLGTRAFVQSGRGLGADSSLTLKYLRPNEDFVNEREIATWAVTFHLTDTIKIPASVTWANKQEFIDEDDVRGHIGFSYSFQGLNGG